MHQSTRVLIEHDTLVVAAVQLSIDVVLLYVVLVRYVDKGPVMGIIFNPLHSAIHPSLLIIVKACGVISPFQECVPRRINEKRRTRE